MPRYKLTIEYFGTGLLGWQRQKEGASIQRFLSEAIFKLCGEKDVIVQGSGRTDAGVHALGQVAHFDIKKWYQPNVIMRALNFYLKKHPVSIIAAEEVTEDFHARFSAKQRHYVYRILARPAPPCIKKNRVWHVPFPLDVNVMHEAAQLLVGQHDFSSFRASLCQSKSPIKTIDRLDVIKNGEEIEIYVSALSFLHHQVRNFAGTLKLVGAGKWTINDVQKALDAKDRTKGGLTAPADGLYFLKVDY